MTEASRPVLSELDQKIHTVQVELSNLRSDFDKLLDERSESYVEFFDEAAKSFRKIRDTQLFSGKDSEDIAFYRSYYSKRRNELEDLFTKHEENTENGRSFINETTTNFDVDLSKVEKLFQDKYLIVGQYTAKIEDTASPIEAGTDLESLHLRPGPDSSYAIGIPSQDWAVKQIPFSQLANELSLKIKPPSENQSQESRDILMYEYVKPLTITPVLGLSRTFGRKSVNVMGISYAPAFWVVPLPKANPPLYIELPLQQNVITLLYGATQQGLRLNEISFDPDNKSVRADLEIEGSNTLVNGTMQDTLRLIVKIRAFRGDLKDYVIFIRYMEIPGKRDSSDTDRELMSFVHSFHPVKSRETDPKMIEESLEREYEKFLVANGPNIFWEQFKVLLLRELPEIGIRGYDDITNLTDLNEIKKIIKLVLPFESLAKEVKLGESDESALIISRSEWNNFWLSLHDAERGNAGNFKENLSMLLAEAGKILIPRQY